MAEIAYIKKNPSSTSDLREAIAKLARKMCSEDCTYLQPFISNRLFPLKTHSNDVRPVGIGEVLQRIIRKLVMHIAKEDVQKAVGNLQVCAWSECQGRGSNTCSERIV